MTTQEIKARGGKGVWIKVVSPPSVRDEVAAIAKEVVQAYEDDVE